MKMLQALTLAALLAAASVGRAGETPTADDILGRLHSEHPRLLLREAEFDQLKRRLPQDPVLIAWTGALRREAEKLLDAPPAEYRIPDGKRLLATSRTVLRRAYTLALMSRLDEDDRFRDRLRRELQAAAAFKDWNPSHFLDTAEMTHAFAIGYDWLYHQWTDDQRRLIREAIVRHGLTPGLKSYRGEERYGWWRTSDHNWNQVCNGGLTLGALAIADEAPRLSGEILAAAIASLPKAMASYAPDGAWGEGVGYWHYATSYNVAMLAALDSALGTDFGLSQAEGFDRTGEFPIHLLGPGGSFNFADTGAAGVTRAPEMLWLARRFNQPQYAAWQRRHAEPHPLDVVWWRPPQGEAPQPPPDACFRGAEIVTMRSSWDDPEALFVALKAGDNKVNHSHLDTGAFVLDALGERWALDLGADDYNLPGYFGAQRWSYYRLRAEGHNTLLINPGEGADQDPRAATRIARFEGAGQSPFAVADLTPAYAAHAERVQRGVSLPGRRAALIQDEIQCKRPSDVWWMLHTPAAISLDKEGRMATLEQRGKRLRVRLAAPAEARFQILSAEPLPTSPAPRGQRVNRGVSKLAIHLSGVREARIAAVFEPLSDGATPNEAPPIRPLGEW